MAMCDTFYFSANRALEVRVVMAAAEFVFLDFVGASDVPCIIEYAERQDLQHVSSTINRAGVSGSACSSGGKKLRAKLG